MRFLCNVIPGRLIFRFHDDSMTLGHVYDLDLKKNEGLIKDVIIQAQGEVCEVDFFVNTL